MTSHTKGILLTLSGVVLMSVESPLIQISGLSALSVGFFFGISLMIATNLMLISKGKKFFIDSYTTSTKGVVLSGLLMGMSNFCFVMAVYYTGIAKTVLILAASPIISALIAFIFLKQKTPMRIFVATFFVFIGLYFILADDLGQNSLIGNLYAFACVLCFSSLFCILTFYKDASRLGYISFGGFFVALFCVWGANFDVTLTALIPVVFMGLFITPFSRLFIGLGTRYLIPAEVGLLVIGESILAPIWGWWWLDEVISQSVFIGGAIILFSLMINSLATLKK
ncbi:MAG TPA: DMT family transporter [Arcobacter sp.]|nr:DMT family transporter [Arcobacter sp.]